VDAYCLKCREKREMESPIAEWSTNGSPATRGSCSVCGTKMYRRGTTEAHATLAKPTATTSSRRNTKAKSPARTKGKSAAKAPRRSGKLVVVESPAKGRTIGKYLGKGFVVKSSVGHVRDLLRSRLSVDLENDYEPEYRVPNDKRAVVKELTASAARAKEIYLATDPDREGEAIAWHILESAEMDPTRTNRVVFHEITKSAILKAFEDPRAIDMDRVDAQQARRILDRLVGYKLSPLLWRKVRGKLSAGRVQSVALRLVVEREREIEGFDPDEYWTIAAGLNLVEGLAQMPADTFRAKLHRFGGKILELGSGEEVAPHVAALERAEWTVSKVKRGTRQRRPYAPFTTSTLQQQSSRQLGFGPSKTMRLSQQLYEGINVGAEGSVGLITYMRTDSVSVSVQARDEARRYASERFGSEFIPEKPNFYRTKSKNAQEAHEAVRPTSVFRTPESVKSFLRRDQLRLYRLIWSRFVASQMSPAVYDTITADVAAGEPGTSAASRPYMFRATGSLLSFPGYLKVFGSRRQVEAENGVEEDGGSNIPGELAEGQELALTAIVPEQHFTQPPPRFSEATLVKALEENGIGRPSTYASIISTILNRGYVDNEERQLTPTEIGFVVNDILVEHFPDVMSVDFTARLEGELDEIVGGKPWRPVIDNFYQRFASRLLLAEEAIPKVDLKSEPEYVGRECPTCGEQLVYREGRYGRFIGCGDFPKCRFTEQIVKKVGVACPKDGGDIIERRGRKRRRVFFGCSNYPDCDWTSWHRPLKRPCAVCGQMLVAKTRVKAECTSCKNQEPVKAG